MQKKQEEKSIKFHWIRITLLNKNMARAFLFKKYTNKKREAKVDKSKRLLASPNLSFVLPLPTIACNVAAESGEKETE